MDIVGPFPAGPQQKKFLLVTVDYFSKWVEAEALARITEEAVIKFLWKSIICRYGIPQRLVFDSGRHNDRRSMPTHKPMVKPKSNRYYGFEDRWIRGGIAPIRATVCALVLPNHTKGKHRHDTVPLGVWRGGRSAHGSRVPSGRRLYDEDNGERRRMELDLVTEDRDRATSRLAAYRQRMCATYNWRVIPRSFQVGDLVWKKVKPTGDVGKLEPRWEGPYRVIKKTSTGAYYLTDSDGKDLIRPWNATHLRPYYT
ncbi:uncharacterized protein LOC141843476 [Curcuma longa]|uniref:uncharacterized protein LOC141843476 n=1 Tax=Curcuma longa TaxID=136217 RepID=UPI003D9E9D3F